MLGNEPHLLGNGRHVSGNGPHVLDIEKVGYKIWGIKSEYTNDTFIKTMSIKNKYQNIIIIIIIIIIIKKRRQRSSLLLRGQKCRA